jgi:hypothetical protein
VTLPATTNEEQGVPIDFSLSPELEDMRQRTRDFIENAVKPIEGRINAGDRKSLISGVIEMRKEAQARGIWLPHMPKEWGGMDLGHVQLAMVQAEAAKTGFGPFAINAQAPDEGNMHTLLHWGSDEQKQKYLKPLCEGMTRSCFAMTEPEVAGSDHTLIRTRAYPDGDEWVITGHKWFISGAHSANFAILICRTEDARTCRGRPTPRSSSISRARDGPRSARSRPCTARPVTRRSASKTSACTPIKCSAAAARATCSASTGSARPGSRTACAGSRRPRWRST